VKLGERGPGEEGSQRRATRGGAAMIARMDESLALNPKGMLGKKKELVAGG